MSEYHNRAAFEARMRERRDDPKPVELLGVFYHVACLGDRWRPIVLEQLRLLAHVGLTSATACVLGRALDAQWCQDAARRLGVALSVPYVNDDPGEFENPTLVKLYRWAQANPGGAALYFHTKGASAPDCPIKKRWRRVMAKWTVANWRDNLKRLEAADVVGANWIESPTLPHFCGNFWLARCDWLARLESPLYYRARHHHDDRRFAGQPWWRMHVECWVGSAAWHHIDSHCCRNGRWWEPHIFGHPDDVEGFRYED